MAPAGVPSILPAEGAKTPEIEHRNLQQRVERSYTLATRTPVRGGDTLGPEDRAPSRGGIIVTPRQGLARA